MTMEASASRGFARILTRLDATTRGRYCTQALEEDLSQVMSEFGLCAQAMAHAVQVDEATKSLVANAASTIHFGSPTIAQLLYELGEMQAVFMKSMESLVAPAQPLLQARATKEAVVSEELRLLKKTQTILTKRRRSTWLSDAMETAGAAVRMMKEPSDEQKTAKSDAKFEGLDEQVYETIKMLRKALLENMDEHFNLVPVLQKMLKKVAKKRPALALFVERSEEIIATKEKKNAEKIVTGETQNAVAAAPAQTKKRKLSDASSMISPAVAPTPEATRTPSAPTDAMKSIHEKAQACHEAVEALGDVFSLSNFDAALKRMVEIVNSLSPLLDSDSVSLITSSLFSFVDKVEKIKVIEHRKDRLVCLKGLLSVVVTSERLAWKGRHDKAIAQSYLTNCRRAIDDLQNQEPSHNAAPPAKRQNHTQGKKVHQAPQETQPKHRKQSTSGTKRKSLHVRFDE